jgi:hypothetical protein
MQAWHRCVGLWLKASEDSKDLPQEGQNGAGSTEKSLQQVEQKNGTAEPSIGELQ